MKKISILAVLAIIATASNSKAESAGNIIKGSGEALCGGLCSIFATIPASHVHQDNGGTCTESSSQPCLKLAKS